MTAPIGETDDNRCLVRDVEEALMYGPRPPTNELLDAAYSSELVLVANEKEWWTSVWPLVQPIERSLRAGQVTDPHDELALWSRIRRPLTRKARAPEEEGEDAG